MLKFIRLTMCKTHKVHNVGYEISQKGVDNYDNTCYTAFPTWYG